MFCKPNSSLLPLRSGITNRRGVFHQHEARMIPLARRPDCPRHRRREYEERRPLDEVDRHLVQLGEQLLAHDRIRLADEPAQLLNRSDAMVVVCSPSDPTSSPDDRQFVAHRREKLVREFIGAARGEALIERGSQQLAGRLHRSRHDSPATLAGIGNLACELRELGILNQRGRDQIEQPR